MGEKRFTLRALLLTAVITLALTLGGVALTAWLRLGPGGLAVLESMELIRERFVGEYGRDQVVDSALDAMVDSLDDRWSSYLTPEEYGEMDRRRGNAYVGVGLTYQVGEDGGSMVIVGLTPGSPAERAGLLVGESIVAIDGEDLTPENLEKLVAGIGQAEGRELAFTVVDADGGRREVRLASAQVASISAYGELLEGGVGYVRLENFYAGSAGQTVQVVEELREEGAVALLFDVRSNPGGYVKELTDLLDYLLPQGPIFAEHTKNGSVKVTQSDEDCVDLPMAVMVNADSYSAAELFAAQLRESVSAPLVGEQTCGKGYYQQVFRLPNGGGLNLSTGMYTTGAGVSLIGVGLTPDRVETDPAAQMEAALELLEGKLG